jgi:putative nucleotidyltransferase with HDIG domain
MVQFKTDLGYTRLGLLSSIADGHNLELLSRHLDEWPELMALETTPQDPEWHAEGNVLIHTEMVLKETPRIIKEMEFNEREALVLRLSCLFHDIMKPTTTEYSEEIGHTIAAGHERQGGIKTRYLLHEFPQLVSNTERILISNLVATHHLVKRAVKRYDDPDGVAFLISLAARVDTRMLYALELADMRGRVCKDQQQQIDIVEYFRMICEEHNVFGHKPIPWQISLSSTSKAILEEIDDSDSIRSYVKFEVHRRRLNGTIANEFAGIAFANEHIQKIKTGHHPFPAEVIMTVGVAGSGKSTLHDLIYPDFDVVSLDATRKRLYGREGAQGEPGVVVQETLEDLRKGLRSGGQVFLDATNVIPDHRAKFVSLCHDYGARLTMAVFDTPLKEVFERNSKRERVVPRQAIESQASKFELPLPEEAHCITYVF